MNLPTHILVDAAKALCTSRSVPFMVRQSGDRDRGTIFVCMNNMSRQARIYRQERDQNFELGWRSFPDEGLVGEGLMDEKDAEVQIRTAMQGDPDQWIIEVEDKDMQFPFEGPIIQTVMS